MAYQITTEYQNENRHLQKVAIFLYQTFPDPTIECFDPAYVTDRKGTYQTFFTDVDFGILGYTDVSNSAESPLRNSRNYQSNAVKAVIESVSEKHTAKSGWNLWRKRLESRVRAYTGKHEAIM
ncbi:MAG TPA: hypothetical protein IAA44_07160 [Candidatus Blautia avistercoris]|nr:hypothetical protein [Candidatus Blautia avistercoris]